MKLKLQTIRKRCVDGELYVFKNGIAQVPGMRTRKGGMSITLKEFNELNGDPTDHKLLTK